MLTHEAYPDPSIPADNGGTTAPHTRRKEDRRRCTGRDQYFRAITRNKIENTRTRSAECELQGLEERLAELRADIAFMEQRAEAGDIVLPLDEYHAVIAFEAALGERGPKALRSIDVDTADWKHEGF